MVARVAVVVVACLGVAVLKPWGAGAPDPTVAAARGAASRPDRSGPLDRTNAASSGVAALGASPTPYERPSLRPGEIDCPGADWELVSIDRLADWTVRTWTPVAPVAASDPLDPSIPIVPLGDAVLALGACRPFAAAEGPPTASLEMASAWTIDRGRARPIALWPLGSPGDAERGLAALYRPAPISSGPTARWPSGSFVLALVPATASARSALVPSTEDDAAPRYVRITIPAGP